MKIVMGAGVFLVILVFTEVLRRWLRIRHELLRKVAHVCSGIAVVFLVRLFTVREIMFLTSGFAVFLVISKYSGWLPGIHEIGRKSWGEVFYPIGIGLSAFFFVPENIPAFRFGILVLAFADALAGIVGESWGKHPITLMGNRKSLEGSAAFFSAVFLMLLISRGWSGEFLLSFVAVALLLTLVELFLFSGLDNLLLPVCASYLFSLPLPRLFC